MPGIPAAVRLAGALGVPVEQLAEGVDDDEEEQEPPEEPRRPRRGKAP
jgi:hypothetical protein